MVIVYLTAAIICFSGECHPVLAGDSTPKGVFPIVRAKIEAPLYGGDVLVFAARNGKRGIEYQAIHRVWLGKPAEKRMERLQSKDPKVRRFISDGCINVHPVVYDKLVACCTNDPLHIVD